MEEHAVSWREFVEALSESLRSTQFWLGLIAGVLATLFVLLILYASVGYDLYR